MNVCYIQAKPDKAFCFRVFKTGVLSFPAPVAAFLLRLVAARLPLLTSRCRRLSCVWND